MEGLEVLGLLAGAAELDGLAGDRAYGQRRAAAGVAVELGHDDAGDIEGLVEGVGDGDRVLTRHAVHDEQDLGGLDRALDIDELLHELLVDMQSARGVDEHGVVAVFERVRYALPGDIHGIALPHLEHLDADLFADDLELLYRRGTIDIAGDEQGALALLFEIEREFAAHGGLARTLQTAHHVDGGRPVGDGEFPVRTAHEGDELVIDDLDYLLRGGERFQDILAERLFADGGDEVLDDGEIDIRLEKGDPDLTHRLLDLELGELPLVAELGEDVIKSVREVLEKGHLFLQQGFCRPYTACAFRRVAAAQSRLRLGEQPDRPSVACRQPELALIFGESALPSPYAVEHSLPRHRKHLGELAEGYVLVAVQTDELVLPVGEKRAVVRAQRAGLESVHRVSRRLPL